MAFWEEGLGNMLHAGIQPLPQEVEWLEQGGPVMYLRELPHPERYFDMYRSGSTSLLWRGDTRPACTPLVVDAVGPLEQYGDMPAWDYFEKQNGPAWRRYPAYLGTARWDTIVPGNGYDMSLAEELQAWRCWSCLPLIDADHEAAAIRLAAAAEKALGQSLYYELDHVFGEEASGEMYAEDVCVALGVTRDGSKSDEEWREIKASAREMVEGAGWADATDYTALAAAFMSLREAGVMRFSWEPSEEEITDEQLWARLGLGHPLDYIEESDHLARDLWAHIHSRRRISTRKAEQLLAHDPTRLRTFQSEEFWIAS